MRQLLPLPSEDVDAYDVYRRASTGRSVRINMVTSVDGRITDAEGRSGGLGGDGDFAVFRALRALSDGILVGAGTARKEGYGPHRVPAVLAERRRSDGRDQPAAIIVVSRSLDLDPTSRLFAEAVTPTMVLTSESSAHRATDELRKVAKIVVAGDDKVDLSAGLTTLADEHGILEVLCEGGPTLNQALLRTGLVDELCVTFAPLVTGAEAAGMVQPPAPHADLELRALCERDGELYVRYGLRAAAVPAEDDPAQDG